MEDMRQRRMHQTPYLCAYHPGRYQGERRARFMILRPHLYNVNAYVESCRGSYPSIKYLSTSLSDKHNGHELSAKDWFAAQDELKHYFDFPTAESPNNMTLTTLSSTLAAPAMDQSLDLQFNFAMHYF
jgi:hypothetical protein